MLEIYVVAMTLVSALMVAGAQYLFKKHLPLFKINMDGIRMILRNKGLLLGIFIYFVALVVYLAALHYGDLSYVYPIFASSFVFTMVVASFVLKEKADWMRVLGILLTILGIAIVALT